MFGRPVICSDVGGMAERNLHDVFALHFAMGDHQALAATICRAASEPGLWERLSAALPEPPAREEMVEGFLGVYQPPGGGAGQAR